MRGQIAGLATPCPVVRTLPSIYHDDVYAQGLCDAFDNMLAPAFLVLDSFPAYLDPATAPDDTLNWLAGWIGLTLQGHESAGRKRELIAAGAELLRWRGTLTGLRDAVTAAFGVVPEVAESGGVTCSTEPTSLPPTDTAPHITVNVRVTDVAAFDARRLDEVVRLVKPAHVPHQIAVLPRG
jgi:phage tail-like protein